MAGAVRTARHETVQLGVGEMLVVEHHGHSLWGRGSPRFDPRLQAGSGRNAESRYWFQVESRES